MGYGEFNVTMESRTGSVSSGLGCNPGVRGQTLKSSPFCPRTSSKLTQSIIKDHMVSHYKKVYSAKAAVDTSVPKSLLQSVKYNDQIRQERLRKGARPLSASSFSQRTSRSSCSSAQSASSVQYDDRPYLCSRSSVVSSPRFPTSFNANDIVYPACKSLPHHTRSSSEMKYRKPEASHSLIIRDEVQEARGVLQRKQSACSLAALRDQGCFKTFQDPVQKTYSGDLLQKHSQHFTQDKPFTPKILKSEKSSYLSKYRYYRTPQRKPKQDCSNSNPTHRETNDTRMKNEEYTRELNGPSQGYSTERDWSEDEVNDTYLSPPRQKSPRAVSRKHYLSGSSIRFSPDARRSLIMSRISAEEEELKYLEFISAVTEDILSKGHISNRVVDRVMKRHIDMNLHQLNEAKMRHLLELLRKDFEEPTSISSFTAEPEIRGHYMLDTIFSHLECDGKQLKTKEDADLFPYVSLIKHGGLCDDADPFLSSTPLGSLDRTPTSTKINESDGEEKDLGCSLIAEDVSDRGTSNDQEDFHQRETTPSNDVHSDNVEHSTVNSDLNQASIPFDGQSRDLDDLGESLSELLHVSSDTHSENVETNNDQDSNVVASVSDDEF